MATLTESKPRDYYEGDIREYPVVASDIIYGGAAVGANASGYARPLQAGDPFRGFAVERVNNSSGSAGDKYVRAKTEGYIRLPISGLAITDVGKDVYASDDDTFTLTESTNTRIGYVHGFIESGIGVVAFSAARGVEAELTDSSGGTTDGTLEAVASSGADADINSNFAEIGAKVNSLIRRMGS